jgi:hypothetical protein
MPQMETKNYITPLGHQKIREELLHLLDKRASKRSSKSFIGPLVMGIALKTVIISMVKKDYGKLIVESDF